MNKNVKPYLAHCSFIRRMATKENRNSIESMMSLRQNQTIDDLRAKVSAVRPQPVNAFPTAVFNRDRSIDLSVIIPVYNVEEYLEQCLDSLYLQEEGFTYEVIAIDDGSTDSSGDILDEYSKRYANLRVFHFSNAGMSAARNRGIEQSRGKWIAFVDSDDVMSICDLRKMVEDAASAGVDYVAASYELIDENGIVVEPPRQLLESDLSVAWGAIYKSSIWESLRFPEGCWYEDTIIVYLVWSRYVGKSFPGAIYRYRQRAGSIVSTTEGNPKGLDYFWLTEAVINEGSSRDIPVAVLANLTLKRLGPTMLFCSESLDAEQMKTLFLLCSEIVSRFEPICHDGSYWHELEAALRSRDYRRWLWCCLAIALERNLNGAKRAMRLLMPQWAFRN